MRIVIRLVIALVVLFALVMGLEQIAAESGEVVVLTTKDEAGQPQQTRLWIVIATVSNGCARELPNRAGLCACRLKT